MLRWRRWPCFPRAFGNTARAALLTFFMHMHSRLAKKYPCLPLFVNANTYQYCTHALQMADEDDYYMVIIFFDRSDPREHIVQDIALIMQKPPGRRQSSLSNLTSSKIQVSK
jgi:hypothetical protein